MIVVNQVPWYVWASLALALLVAGVLSGRKIRPSHPLVPFAAGILTGLLIASTVAHAAPRPAALDVIPAARMGYGEPDLQARRTGVPTSDGVTTTALGTPKPPAALRGRASWVRASLGAGYMAARMPRGTRLRVCGPLACFTGVVTDYGPSKRLHPDRIVDLSRSRFARVCGDPETLGTCAVRVWVVDVRLPETDR